MAIRRNIVGNSSVRNAYVQGTLLLKAESADITTADLDIPSRHGVPAQDLSTWDMFVYWHMVAMYERGNGGRNAAHSGPVFLPWHRWFLISLEAQFQRVLQDDDFGLPYWDWAADGEFTAAQQRGRPVWNALTMGGNGTGDENEVTTGPFGGSAFRVRIEGTPFAPFMATDRPLRRSLGSDVNTLPQQADVAAAISGDVYDSTPWNQSSTTMRNLVEGWRIAAPKTPPATHNRVHVWVGGDMGPASSPNDPVFFLNHCNVDRIWARWQADNPNAAYLPPASASNDLRRHRRNDPLLSIFTQDEPRVSEMLDVSATYTYDNLNVF